MKRYYTNWLILAQVNRIASNSQMKGCEMNLLSLEFQNYFLSNLYILKSTIFVILIYFGCYILWLSFEVFYMNHQHRFWIRKIQEYQ